MAYGFVYYLNPSSAITCFIRNVKGESLLIRRRKEPAKGMLDLPGGFADMSEPGEEATRREVREETGLYTQNYRYLFSLPNLYMYPGFEVYTLDMFYKCLIDDFNNVHTEDDTTEVVIPRPGDANPEDSGLDSIRKAVPVYPRR